MLTQIFHCNPEAMPCSIRFAPSQDNAEEIVDEAIKAIIAKLRYNKCMQMWKI
jgi:hypothetical protein